MVKKEIGFEFHFCTRNQNSSNQYEQNWYVLHFKDDWVALVQEYGLAPFDSITEPLKLFKEKEYYKNAYEKATGQSPEESKKEFADSAALDSLKAEV